MKHKQSTSTTLFQMAQVKSRIPMN